MYQVFLSCLGVNCPGPSGEVAVEDVTEGATTPEDFWSPLSTVAFEDGWKEDYGAISTIPEHDGTECLKWDDTLWTHAEHFKVLRLSNFRCALTNLSGLLHLI